MEFRTKYKPGKEYHQIDYSSNVLLIGSCFSESIFEKLDYFKFNTAKNPLGIVYNPIAIEKLVLNAINAKEYTEQDIFYLNERYHCFDAHSELSSPEKHVLLNNLNERIQFAGKELARATHIVFTLGTSWVYRHIETDSIVANCHKVPQRKFLKELCSVDKIEDSLNAIIALVRSVNPEAGILFTVSPIRHLKDGFSENALSKAHLLTAINNIINRKERINYFPSYEIMLDDLRDYRFYTDDMLHPNKTAISYIWKSFKESWIHTDATPVMKKVAEIRRGLSHRPFNPESEQHQLFLKQLNNKINDLRAEFQIKF